jgi:hypothetical protein
MIAYYQRTGNLSMKEKVLKSAELREKATQKAAISSLLKAEENNQARAARTAENKYKGGVTTMGGVENLARKVGLDPKQEVIIKNYEPLKDKIKCVLYWQSLYGIDRNLTEKEVNGMYRFKCHKRRWPTEQEFFIDSKWVGHKGKGTPYLRNTADLEQQYIGVKLQLLPQIKKTSEMLTVGQMWEGIRQKYRLNADHVTLAGINEGMRQQEQLKDIIKASKFQGRLLPPSLDEIAEGLRLKKEMGIHNPTITQIKIGVHIHKTTDKNKLQELESEIIQKLHQLVMHPDHGPNYVWMYDIAIILLGDIPDLTVDEVRQAMFFPHYESTGEKITKWKENAIAAILLSRKQKSV